jgi:hypothetical protein
MNADYNKLCKKTSRYIVLGFYGKALDSLQLLERMNPGDPEIRDCMDDMNVLIGNRRQRRANMAKAIRHGDYDKFVLQTI